MNKNYLIDKFNNLEFKNEFIYLYLEQMYSIRKLANHFNLCNSSISKAIHFYGLSRDKGKMHSNAIKQHSKETWKKITDRLTYDIVYDWYIKQDNKYSDAPEHFNISYSTFDKLCRYYGIHKDRAEVNRKKLIDSYSKYGSKENYIKSMLQTRDKTIISKYGSKENFYKTVVHSMESTCLQKYGVTNISQLADTAKKRAETRSNCIASDNTAFDSSWECLVYEYCLRNNIPIKRNISIAFEYQSKIHHTIIDFEIDGMLFEVKGEHLLKGCYDHKQIIPIDVKLDVYRKNNVILITNFRELFKKHNNKINFDKTHPLIGVDIDLFNNPQFPYANDKPKCFYDVKVNHCMSMFEAFNNEAIRWKMIKNRIKYMGGFIDSKQVLTALNVTRTAKQPSWFSKSFAKYIISKYISSDIIVDPFAGWGTRCDASLELNKQYIGCDLNKELVNWHQSLNKNITYGDAKRYSYNGECSVFVCPPYQDIEIYFDNQDTQLTQCQWLNILMKNIPNAKEYVMVCKTVDKGWEKYIVETKENKSHFGTNIEYILKIDNKKIK